MTDITTELVDQNTDLDSLGPIDYIVVEFRVLIFELSRHVGHETPLYAGA